MSVELPTELQGEILSWLPPKSLMRFKCVSKNWASKIREKNFEDLYLVRSKTRPQVLFVFYKNLLDPTPGIIFHSVYQDEKLSLSSGQQQMRLSDGPPNAISAPIRGLICHRQENKVMVYNPGMRKFRTLPEIGEYNASIRASFLGYDEAAKVFKVLCMAFMRSGKSDGSRKYQAFTLGLGEESWRPIVCKHDHYPTTNGVWKGEVLYYGAWSGNGHSIAMSFNVRSEEFNVIDFPERIGFGINDMFVNYKGKIAYVNNSVIQNGEIKMLVRNEITGKWLRECIVISPWKEMFEDRRFSFEGIIGTGELAFTQIQLFHDGSFFVVYYNSVTENFTKFKIDGGVGGSYHYVRTFLNHVDSLSLP